MVVRLLENKSESLDKSPRVRAITDGDQEAKQWKGYVDTLKSTVDLMHDICLAKQNVLGCEEALMYLTSAVRDFQSLISSINVEREWKDSENRPNAVRWEVIGTTNRRKGLSTKQLNETVPIQPRDLNESCIQCRTKRRMASDLSDEENSKKTNGVYERLAYGKRSNVARPVHTDQPIVEKLESEELRKPGCITGKLTMPRSAMDIPQTKSSMAKIAASRQLLWQRHKKILTEKLSAKRRQEQSLATLGNRRRSLPILAAKQASNSKPVQETNLESIHEMHEEDKNEIGDVDNSSTKTHAGFKTRSDGYAFNLLDMSDDDQWRALTEEEESLVQEELSLKKEIDETESLSIDEELQRRVILDFSDVNIESDWKSVVDEWAVENGNEEENDLEREAAVETPKLPQQPNRIRQPGELVQIHQRLLSPLRKRNLDAEEIHRRQAKAEELRIMLQERKANHLKILHAKVEDVLRKRVELMEKKRIHLANKMEKAAENRQRNLDDITKRLKENARGLENNFVNIMEVEQARLALQLKEQDREQRRINLAEGRSKQAQEKASKGAAMDEKKRTMEQQKVEKQREQVAKKQERQTLIETQKSEAVESQRKKARVYEQKLEAIKTNEMLGLESLKNKIQQKTTKSSKRYETVVEQIRQKAIGLSRPNWFASLADCTVPPSDLSYSLAENNCGKKCTKCDYIAVSDLESTCSSHFNKTSIEPLNGLIKCQFRLLELENFIRVTEDRALTDNEELNLSSMTLNKKLRAKLKQKLGTFNLALDINVTSSPLRHSFDKKSNDLRNAVQERHKYSEQQRKKIEQCLNELWRCFNDQKPENRSSMTLFAQQSGLIVSLFDFLFKNSSTSFECTSKIFYRLMCKVSHLILELLMANVKVCCTLFFTDNLFNLLEWTSDQFENGMASSNLEERADLLISAYCIVMILIKGSSGLLRNNLNKFVSQLNDRLQSIGVYLMNSNFLPYYKSVVLNGTDQIEFGFGQSVRPLSILSNVIVALNTDPETPKNVDSQILNLHLAAIQCLMMEIYAKIRFEPIVSSSSDGTLMSSSFKILEAMKEDESIRFVYILIVALYNNDKSLNLPDDGNQLTFCPPSLTTILDATAWFASLSFKHQVICTIGWQKSLLVHICKLPFEHFQNSTLRSHLLTALIVILLDNSEGLVLIREFITPSWMADFLKEVMHADATNDRRCFERFLPESQWRRALQFFEPTKSTVNTQK
ncbi:C2H2-type domain-containing protein [Aphelenchoides bicaudatus]|nr:C2H2-type domain-containing protein [Aphelenchoides bicaudatus]